MPQRVRGARWRFGIREKFALLAIALVSGSSFILNTSLSSATSKVVVDHELTDLADEAELRCWEVVDSTDQLRTMVGTCAIQEANFLKLLEYLNTPKPRAIDEDLPQWVSNILAVHELSRDKTVATRYATPGIALPNIPQECLNVTWADPADRFEPHVSPVLPIDLPQDFSLPASSRDFSLQRQLLRAPVMWGLCRKGDSVLAVLLLLERTHSARHLSFMLDQSKAFLQHPSSSNKASPELGLPFSNFDFAAEVTELDKFNRWTGQESDIQIQRGRLYQNLPLTNPFYLLEGEATESLQQAISHEEAYKPAAFTRWNEDQRILSQSAEVNFGGASTTIRTVRLLASSPERLRKERDRIEVAYQKLFPQVESSPIKWRHITDLKHVDAQLVRFYLRLKLKERPGFEALASTKPPDDPPLYFMYAAFREELSGSVNHEFREATRGSILLSLAAGVVAFLASIYFVRPLLKITRAVRKLPEKTQLRESEAPLLHHKIATVRASLPVRRRDEVGDIARALENLLDQVTTGQLLLKTANANLETRVRERTVDLSKANIELLSLDKAKDEFIATVSHETRRPLNNLVLYAEILRKTKLSPEQYRYMDKLSRTLTALNRLLNDIFDYEKIIVKVLDLVPEPFDGAEFFLNLKETIDPAAQERKNTLEFHGIDNLGELFQDKGRLEQIFGNLLANACKFTLGGIISVEANIVEGETDDNPWLVVSITDTGRGMTDEDKKKLFVPFMKLAASEGNKTGTGLGLVITKGLCELMGGSIEYQSEIGRGTTFTVKVPAKLPGKPLVQPAVVAPPRVSTASDQPPLILVVDDEADVRRYLQEFLQEKGFTVITAADGEEAFAIARRSNPAVITLDVVLPGKDGWEVLATLKSDPVTSHIPVVMVTFLDQREHGFALGAVDYLVKPIEAEELSKRLSRLVGFKTNQDPVLIVDDDSETREVLRIALEGEGRKVVEAVDGADALLKLTTVRPSAILLDLAMPVMDGFQFVEEFRRHADWQGIPILVVTARDTTAEDRERLNGSVRAILAKRGSDSEPFLAEILALIRKHAPPSSSTTES